MFDSDRHIFRLIELEEFSELGLEFVK